MSTWATTSDVLSITGATVTTGQLGQAQGVIEIFAGLSADNTTTLSTGNARLLKSAVAYQAAWMAAQVDVTTRTDVASLSQDGAAVTPANDDALILAPLAKRCLDRLTWRASRSIRVVRACDRPRWSLAELAVAYMQDETPDPWRRL